jgi:hypothetical protein
MKSILNGKKTVASGTKRTPPPTPETGATSPISNAKTNNNDGQNHIGCEPGDPVVSPTSPAQQLPDIARVKITATVMNNTTCDFLKRNT